MLSKKKKIAKKVQEKILDMLAKMPLLDKLDGAEIETLKRYVSILDVEAGEVVFSEGDRGDYVCFVVKGKLDIYKTAFDREKVILATVPAGRCLGEMALVDQFTRSATAQAKEPTYLIVLSSENFNTLCETNPKMSNKILREVARLLSLNLRKTSANVVHLSH